MIAILSSIKPSDNGNEFLCLRCEFCNIRSGRLTEIEAYCGNHEFQTEPGYTSHIRFAVTQCSGFLPRNIGPSRQEKAALEGTAYHLVPSKEGRGVCFVTYAEYKQRQREGEV